MAAFVLGAPVITESRRTTAPKREAGETIAVGDAVVLVSGLLYKADAEVASRARIDGWAVSAGDATEFVTYVQPGDSIDFTGTAPVGPVYLDGGANAGQLNDTLPVTGDTLVLAGYVTVADTTILTTMWAPGYVVP